MRGRLGRVVVRVAMCVWGCGSWAGESGGNLVPVVFEACEDLLHALVLPRYLVELVLGGGELVVCVCREGVCVWVGVRK